MQEGYRSRAKWIRSTRRQVGSEDKRDQETGGIRDMWDQEASGIMRQVGS
jgi:hypothetical protein